MLHHDIRETVLKSMRVCPHCQTEYRTESVTPLIDETDMAVSHVLCANCQMAMLSLCVVTPMGTSTFGMITDLSSKESLRHLRRVPISEDDLLRWHSQIIHERIV